MSDNRALRQIGPLWLLSARLRFVAAIDDPKVIRRILGHLELPTSIAPPLPARPPPETTQPFDWV